MPNLPRERHVISKDAFAEVVVWRLPQRLAGSPHGFKYRLAYVVGGTCVLRFDNESGKGDHRHEDDVESPYRFQASPELLWKVLNAERWDLLKCMSGRGPMTLADLAGALRQDEEPVRAHVRDLSLAGVVDALPDERFSFSYHAIHVDFLLRPA